jgi:hypothetical protein
MPFTHRSLILHSFLIFPSLFFIFPTLNHSSLSTVPHSPLLTHCILHHPDKLAVFFEEFAVYFDEINPSPMKLTLLLDKINHISPFFTIK